MNTRGAMGSKQLDDNWWALARWDLSSSSHEGGHMSLTQIEGSFTIAE